MRADLPTGTVTFLFTDVEGSTKLLEEIGDEAYAAALADHRGVVREACADRGGVEVDTQGDAFFVAFPSAPGALEAAAQITERLAGRPILVLRGGKTGFNDIYGCGGSLNFTVYRQRLVTSDLDDADRILDADQRVRVLNRADRRIAKDVPVIPLYQVPLVYAFRTSLRGIDPAPFDPFWNAENWWLER
jgi:class 3 adenylate cyclase